MLMLCLGFMGFMSSSFWLSLYLQEIKHSTAIEVAAQLLPMVINGILVNVVCGLILHKVSNKLLMLIAATGYTASFLILSFMKEGSSYWAFIFPALILVVVGADIEFNVANVSINFPPLQTRTTTDPMICRCTSCPRSPHPTNPSQAAFSTP